MEYLIGIGEIIIRSLASLVALFLLTKLMGVRQVSQLTFFDYIVGITIGSIAAELAADTNMSFFDSLTAMVVYSVAAASISLITNKSIKARRYFSGTPVIMIDDGKIIRANLSKQRYDLNDLLSECRTAGYFNISDIRYAVLEENGKLSILPKAINRPVTTGDMNLAPPEQGLCVSVIMDGRAMAQNLKKVGKNEQWLKNKLGEQDIKHISEVLLATYDESDNLSVYLMDEKAKHKGLLE